MRMLVAYLIGLVFGVGISISGMANPAKVLNFFDIAGHWDPSLAFVMGGALLVTFAGYRWVFSTPKPIMESHFQLPGKKTLDTRLISGAAIFGIGWGLTGFCPGGALPALGTGQQDVIVFVLSFVAGIGSTRLIERRYQQRKLPPANVAIPN